MTYSGRRKDCGVQGACPLRETALRDERAAVPRRASREGAHPFSRLAHGPRVAFG